MARRIIPALMAIVLATAPGCDGDAPSKAEFAGKANEICRNAQKDLREVGQNAKTRQEAAKAVDEVIDRTRDSVDELDGLDRPDGAAGKAAKDFVDEMKRELDENGVPALRDLRDALQKGDRQAAEDAARRLRRLDTANADAAARKAGATACTG